MYLIMFQIWSDDLADLAENWARECIKGHSDKSLRKTKKFKKVGENIHRSTRMWLRYKLFMDLLKKSRIYLLNPRWLIRPHSFFFFFFTALENLRSHLKRQSATRLHNCPFHRWLLSDSEKKPNKLNRNFFLPNLDKVL